MNRPPWKQPPTSFGTQTVLGPADPDLIGTEYASSSPADVLVFWLAMVFFGAGIGYILGLVA